jgi:predicted ArsR family transcriptional regulator
MVLVFRRSDVVPDDLADQASSVAALADPVRRALYRHVAGRPDAVSREQVSAACEVPLHSVKFHLDRLVDAGLLEVEFRRLSGRTGPGAGRPSKLYRRSARQVTVSLPDRRYDLVGEILAEAVDRSTREATPVADVVAEVAEETGRRIGADELAASRDAGLADVCRVLARRGFEPQPEAGELCLTNCPFDRLATAHTDLVCGLNLALVGGILSAVPAPGLRARLAPAPGYCCVRVSD